MVTKYNLYCVHEYLHFDQILLYKVMLKSYISDSLWIESKMVWVFSLLLGLQTSIWNIYKPCVCVCVRARVCVYETLHYYIYIAFVFSLNQEKEKKTKNLK